MTPAEELERGRLATDVLENPVFVDALRQIQSEIVARWQSESDSDKREWLWTLSQASKRLEAALRETMQTGLLRQQQIEQHQTRLQRANAAVRKFI